jgi:outer membrane protein OmpA-like peptidoglycan-associated protein
MTKITHLKLATTLLSCLCGSYVQAQDYAVLLASYNSKIPIGEYFKGINDVREYQEPPFYKYYQLGFNTEEEAQKAAQAAKTKGFTYARAENFSVLRSMKAGCCTPFKASPISTFDNISLRNIFFDFDKSDLKPESIQTLNNAVSYLKQHTDCTLELLAHTDAKGTNEYNDALSERRKNSALNYLIKHGIATSRLSGRTFGKNAPIAKNESNGTDAPEGRSLNRRVELVVKRNGEIVPIVEIINVPSDLK